MAYSRTFITLKQGCSDYVKDVRGCVGRAIVEIRNGRGRLLLQAQGLKSDNDYRVCVLSKDDSVEVDRPLYVNNSGRGEVKWEFKPDGVLSDIRALAVLVKDKAPLIGFVKDEYNWQQCLMAKPENHKQPETIMAIKPEIIEVKEPEEIVSAVVEDKVENIEKEQPVTEIEEELQNSIAENATEEINQKDKEKIVQLVNEFSDSIDEIQAIAVSANTDYIFSRNEVKPFGDDNIKWVKVNIREICAVKDLWKYCNNPFVIKGCREYKHLLLGRDGKNYWMGVPCKYDPSYKLEAQIQGFKECKPMNGGELKAGESCYCLLKC